MTVGLLRRSRASLIAAVHPESLSSVLASLKAAGMIENYEERPSEVFIWGDLTALESRLHSEASAQMSNLPVDRRAEYFRRCRHYMHTASFRRLPQQNRAVFRLHANGSSVSAIALQLGLTRGKVWNAIRGARLAADLPETTSTMPRGPAPRQLQCSEAGCERPAVSRGMCHPHYARWWRRGTRAGDE